MKAFQYVKALSAASAPELHGEEGTYIAGGNDLLGLLKEYLIEPKVLVSVRELPGSNKIEPGDSVWSLGANVTVAEIEEHDGIRQTFPGLRQAAADVGSQQIRNVATLAGNLAQHSRCWYFRHRDIYCLKKGGDTCYARHGENRYHSLFTGNTCISPVVSNLATALTALDASVILQRAGQTVRLSMPELYARAWDNPTLHHSLEPGDLILKVEIPNQGQRSAYLQASEKTEFDWALVSCSAAATFNGSSIAQGRVVLGSVSPVPYQDAAANRWLAGKELDEQLAGQVADRILSKATPMTDNGYKVPLARTLIVRTLLKLKA